MNKNNLVKNVQYYCISPLYRIVWFVEMCGISSFENMAFVDWIDENGNLAFGYVNSENLIETI